MERLRVGEVQAARAAVDDRDRAGVRRVADRSPGEPIARSSNPSSSKSPAATLLPNRPKDTGLRRHDPDRPGGDRGIEGRAAGWRPAPRLSTDGQAGGAAAEITTTLPAFECLAQVRLGGATEVHVGVRGADRKVVDAGRR